MATGNYNKLQLHKKACELLEAIIQKEEWLARERESLRKLTVRRDYILEVQIPYVKHRIALYERFLQIANKNYAVLSDKICQAGRVVIASPFPFTYNSPAMVPKNFPGFYNLVEPVDAPYMDDSKNIGFY